MNTHVPAEAATPSPSPRKPRRWLRWLTIAIALLLAFWAFLGLLAPRLLQQAVADWAKKHGRQLSIQQVRITPWSMELTLDGLALREGNGNPLFLARRVYLNADAYALLLGRWQASEFTLDSPKLWLERGADGQWNWEKLAADLSGPPKLEDGSAPEKLPRLKIAALNLRDGQVRLNDHNDGKHERFRLMPINLSLTDLSTLAENGRYALHAELEGGGRFDWKGSMRLQPLQSSGEASMQGLPLASIWDYVRPYFSVEKPQGALSVYARYQFEMNGSRPDLTISPLSASLKQLTLRAPGGGGELHLPELKVEGGALDLSRSLLTIAKVELNQGRVSAGRDANGAVDWLRALPSAQPAKPAAKPAQPSPWLVKVDSLRFNRWHGEWRDGVYLKPMQLQTDMPQLQARISLSPEHGLQLNDLGLSLANLKLGAAGGPPWLTLADAELAPSLIDLKLRQLKPGDVTLRGMQLALQRERNGQLQLQQLLAQRPQKAVKTDKTDKAAAWKLSYPAIKLEDSGLSWRDLALPKPLTLGVDQLSGLLATQDGQQLGLDLNGRMGNGRLAAKLDLNPDQQSVHGRIRLDALPIAPLAPYALSGTPLKLSGGALSTDLQLHAASATQWKLAGQLKLAKMALQEPGEALPLLGWNNLSLSRLQVQGMPLKVNINDVRLDQPRARLILDPQRRLNWQQIFASRIPPVKPAGSGKAAPLPQVDVHSIHVQNGAVEFADHGMTPDFATRMHHLRGSIQNLSTRAGGRGRITLDGAVDQYGEVKVRGALSPLSPTDSTDIRLDFHNLALNNLNPYSMNFAGWQVKDGRLSLELRYLLEHRQLKGENRIVIDSIQLGDELKGDKSPHLPLRLAVALLEDSNGRIDLDLPVTGSLDDPQFSYGQVIWKAFVNIVTKVVTAPFRALGALLGGDGFDDIRFVAGEAHVSPPEREKLDKVAGLMAKRPKMQLAISGGYASDEDGKQLARARIDSAVLAAAGHAPMDDEPLPSLDLKDAQTQSAIKTVYGQRIGRLKLLGHTLKPGGPSGEALVKLLRDEMLAAEKVSQADLVKLAELRGANARKVMLRHAPDLAERVTLDAPQKTSANRDGVELAVKITAK
ncbi:hypothetical protein BI347_13000 [Chromobacterium sphagni]|uniref:AsmA domain-containing protein n=1 Tax=Chromobacterium sphagni TaxID=1903179 RepID=A0A1S1X4A4_9NEIS|nr:DUF748 domain-containing protein [Chromobacterium sphagni]OHX14319.1 hypothetical protein BI347_13000 [Chromobacterium sphagni]